MKDDITDLHGLLLTGTPLLDVRAPVEFHKGAFPGATNIPLLDDDERHEIGICYSRHGQEAAIELGHKLVSGDIKAERLARWQHWCEQHPDGVIYCFRGGLRSRTVQQWLAEAGIQRPLVRGGYKAMRRFLLDALQKQLSRHPLLILAGRTGTGKTRVIEALDNAVDLEGLAHHRGSAFGRRPGGQPAQIDFENRLALDMLHLSSSERAIVMEDESRLIGRCYLPVPLQEAMKQAPRVMIDEPLEARVDVTLDDYVIAPLAEFERFYGADSAFDELAQSLLDSIDRIRKRLGGARHQVLRGQLEDSLAQQRRDGSTDAHRHWITVLLRDYYDPMYDYMMAKREGEVRYTGRRNDVARWLASNS
ncbi:MAG: tRNA 2-selenouridine(34) synthase MnmH [Alcanivoracaceae bacterium]|nr:tRNA 2-selenouridine(34) synthase MnmH [Alcanivoracaceae bacterium]